MTKSTTASLSATTTTLRVALSRMPLSRIIVTAIVTRIAGRSRIAPVDTSSPSAGL
ncbi:hypothetical protein SCE1572_36905 [Sorangium cellulosum So0157-2]|uniref:Uncharacterized protein n=1 Tax=Sorangium cellulosum So0157-2 TaxID=1254432 RepID=S4Y562_SORCE|nr:hypothetical protein [Sorangium cellulosum]AGP39586.1 hypothetical protein SCE1572_36905 [Sorangium cellulosum So0157-2]